MTLDLYGRDNRKTFVILLLSANLLLLLAFFVQVSRQKRTAEELSRTMDAAISERTTRDSLDRLIRDHEVVLRERLQARLECEEARTLVADLTTAVARHEVHVTDLTADLARVRTERDEHQSARSALERRLSDALDLLATHDELKARAGELDVALTAVAAASAEQDRADAEIALLRRQIIVLDRLVTALKSRLKAVSGN